MAFVLAILLHGDYVSSVCAGRITTVQNFTIVARLTGAPSINQTTTVGIGGTDLGHMVNHQGQIYFLFGDTFSGETPSQGGNWRHNVMAYSSDSTPGNGIVFDGWLTNASGNASEVIRYGGGNPITEIPTGAVSIGDRIYAWYMAINWWGPPGQWTMNRAGLAYWRVGDSRFANVSGFDFPTNSNFGMVAASLRPDAEGTDDPHLYVWGTPPGRFGGVKLARVMPDQIETLAAYQYFDGLSNGAPQWTSDEFAADVIVPAGVGEMSVMYNEAAGAWTLLYFSEARAAFELRQSPTPWGPWSSPLTVATSAQAPGGLYAPYMNPLYVENGGKSIYFTMSLWNPYDVYLAKVDLSIFPTGDINLDGAVNARDAATFARYLGRTVLASWSTGDFNADGRTTLADLMLLQRNLGDSAPSPPASDLAVPEPTTAVVVLVSTALSAAWRRMKLPIT